MRAAVVFGCLAMAAVAASGADKFKIALDFGDGKISDQSANALLPCVGYAWDAKGMATEADAAACCRDGVRLVRMPRPDVAALRFLRIYGGKAVVGIDGDPEKVKAQLEEVAAAGLADRVAGFVGPGCDGLSEQEILDRWMAVLPVVNKSFPNAELAIPLWNPSMDAALKSSLPSGIRRLSRVCVKMSGKDSPREVLESASRRLKAMGFEKWGVWVELAPGRPGKADGFDSLGMVWKMHAVLTSFANARVSAVFVDDPPWKNAALGAAMRYLAAGIDQCPTFVARGEARRSAVSDARSKGPQLDLDDDDGLGIGGDEIPDLVFAPEVTGRLAKALPRGSVGSAGDVEWVALRNRDYLMLLVVNSRTSEAVADVDLKGYSLSSDPTLREVRFGKDGESVVRDCREEHRPTPFTLVVGPKTFQTVSIPIRKRR